jgi:hypothetical protein
MQDFNPTVVFEATTNLDPNATLLIPVPLPCGGVVVVGGLCITYLNGKARKNIKMSTNAMYKVMSVRLSMVLCCVYLSARWDFSVWRNVGAYTVCTCCSPCDLCRE